MQLLPPIAPGLPARRLPLSTVGAFEAAAALLADDPRSACSLWKSVLRFEPAFLLWTLSRAHQLGAAPQSLQQAARWLADSGVAAWPAEGPACAPASPSGPARPWLHRSMRAVYLGRRAARLADKPLRPRAELLGYLHDARRWLAGSATENGLPLCGLLPEGLIAELESIGNDRRPSRRTPHGCVALALDDFHKQVETGQRPPEIDPLTKSLPPRWQAPTAARPTDLAAIVARLRGLQADFEKRLHEEKMASLAQLAYGATHEINNPLANIATRAQSLLIDERRPERRRALATIHTQAMRAHEMIANMMLFARPPALAPEPLEGAALLAEAASLVADEAARQGTQIELAPSPPVELVGDRRQLLVALRSVLQNSLEALGSGGCIQAAVRRPTTDPDEPGPVIEFILRDNGPGMAPAVKRHAFDPFYCGREAGRGLGFGLSWCWRIVTLHGGTIELRDPPEGGAEVVIALPAAPRS